MIDELEGPLWRVGPRTDPLGIVPVANRSRVAESRGMFKGHLRLPDDFGQAGDEFGDLLGLPRPE